MEVVVVEDDAEGVYREVGGGGAADRRGEGAGLVTHGRGRHHAHVHTGTTPWTGSERSVSLPFLTLFLQPVMAK